MNMISKQSQCGFDEDKKKMIQLFYVIWKHQLYSTNQLLTPEPSMSVKLAGRDSASPSDPPPADPTMPPSVQETMKLLKRLGYPEVQGSSKASSILGKVVTALTKRMSKLEETKTLFQSTGKTTALQDKKLV